ncbi:MAG: hypothetical protein JWM35_1843 [Verrucomicrobia bacterium]|nr:hypothetical protein [Verrucomicrobiota bacterium]
MRLLIPLLLALLLPSAGISATSLANARKAQAMLGPETWTRVIEITNTSATATYPAIVTALVFEEGGLLWFYTDGEGTQSLSLYSNRLAQEKENLGELLRAIDAGFTRFTVVPDRLTEPAWVRGDSVPNGCFIESIAAMRTRILLGETIERPRLLSCYALTRKGLRGHTVLTYHTPSGFFLLDPTHSARPKLMPEKWMENPVALAGVALEGAKVLKARWVALDLPALSTLVTMNPSSPTLSAESTASRLMQ